MSKTKKVMRFQKNLIIAIVSFTIIFTIGIIGYVSIEGWSPLKSVFMTVITLTTIGYSDFELSPRGQMFTLLLIVVGLSIYAYALGSATAFIAEGHLGYLIRRRKMDKEIKKLKNHYIVCGAGDTGIHIINELIKVEQDFVVIDVNEDRIKEISKDNKILYVIGDAANDEILLKAGIEKANGLVASLPEDKDNLFVVLTARSLNENLMIVSKAIEDASVEKIKKAGADKVISPNYLGGLKLASMLLRPNVVEFLNIMMYDQTTTRFEEAILGENTELVGMTLKEAKIPEKTRLVVVAVQQPGSKKFVYNPKAEQKLNAGDALVVIGTNEQLEKLRKITKDPRWYD